MQSAFGIDHGEFSKAGVNLTRMTKPFDTPKLFAVAGKHKANVPTKDAGISLLHAKHAGSTANRTPESELNRAVNDRFGIGKALNPMKAFKGLGAGKKVAQAAKGEAFTAPWEKSAFKPTNPMQGVKGASFGPLKASPQPTPQGIRNPGDAHALPWESHNAGGGSQRAGGWKS